MNKFWLDSKVGFCMATLTKRSLFLAKFFWTQNIFICIKVKKFQRFPNQPNQFKLNLTCFYWVWHWRPKPCFCVQYECLTSALQGGYSRSWQGGASSCAIMHLLSYISSTMRDYLGKASYIQGCLNFGCWGTWHTDTEWSIGATTQLSLETVAREWSSG